MNGCSRPHFDSFAQGKTPGAGKFVELRNQPEEQLVAGLRGPRDSGRDSTLASPLTQTLSPEEKRNGERAISEEVKGQRAKSIGSRNVLDKTEAHVVDPGRRQGVPEPGRSTQGLREVGPGTAPEHARCI